MAASDEAKLAETEAASRLLARVLDGAMPTGVGFALFLFEYGEGGWSSYISSCDRETMITAIEEQLAALRLGKHAPPGAGGVTQEPS